jgi:hypothetical protein
MIHFAIGAFLTGIGIYFGFVWVNNLDPLASQDDGRKVFICLIVSLGFCGCFYGLPLLYKLIADTINSFRTGSIGDFYTDMPDTPVGPQTAQKQQQPGESTPLGPLYIALAATVESQENCVAATRKLMHEYEKLMDPNLRRRHDDGRSMEITA